MRLSIVLPIFLLVASASLGWTQDETPTAVTVQNRTGDLPFSQTVGTSVEHVDIGSGNLIADFPVISLPGRHMPFQYGLRYNALFWTVATRTETNGQQIHFWSIERRPYVGGINNGLGFTPTQAQLSWGISTDTCTNVNGTPPDVRNTASGYIYTDAGGGKHPLPILQISASSIDDGCFAGQDGTGSFQGFAPAEGILAVALDIYSTPAVYLPDGTQVAWPQDNSILNPPVTPDGWAPIDLAQYLDANGNSKCEDPVQVACNVAADTLGRNPLTVVNGTNQVLYRFNDSDGVQRTYTVNLGTISVNTNFGISGVTEHSQTRTVVTSIVLSNGTSYSFQYENGSYGGLNSISLPTGAAISYTWATLSPSGNPFLTHRYVASRTVTVGTLVSTWTFNKSCVDPICSTVNTDVGDPVGNHTLYQHSEGKIVSAKIYNGAVSGTPLREYDVAYNRLTADPNALPISITTTLNNGLQSKVEYGYDTTNGIPGNVAEIREYGYGSGVFGALLRRTHKTYGLNTNPSYLTANIVDKVTDETVYDSTAATCQGAAGPCARTQYEYDNYIVGDNPLQSTSGAAQHDYTRHSVSLTTRGNLTRVKRWRNTDNAWLTTTYSYDDLGNIRSIKDPLGHVTSYDYTDAFANSNCLPPAGTSGQGWVSTVTNAVGQQSKVVRFPCTGFVQAHRDQNDIDAGRVGTIYSYDLMGRLLAKSMVDGGQTSIVYDDVPPVSLTTTIKITFDLNLTSTSVMDGLGRNSEAQLTSDPEGTDYTDTTYDLLGRVATVSNPYRSSSDPTYGITQIRYDALGRPATVTEQDGSIKTMFYDVATPAGVSGNCTLAIDEAGEQRRTCSDALGRLVEVDEPGGNYVGAHAQGDLAVGGSLRFISVNSAQATGSITITGREDSVTYPGERYCAEFTSGNPPRCVDWETTPSTTDYNSGAVTVYVNGQAFSPSYGAASDVTSIANSLAASIRSGSATVDYSTVVTNTSVNPPVATIFLYARAAGAAGNSISLSTGTSTYDSAHFSGTSFTPGISGATLTGGVNGGITGYDSGHVALKLGSFTGATVSYSQTQNNSSADLANAAATAFNNTPGAPATASAQPGSAMIHFTYHDYSQAGNVAATLLTTDNNATYPGGSFTGSTLLAGGQDPTGPSLDHNYYVTVYQYDALGNLLCVEQHGNVTGTGCSASSSSDATSPWRVRRFTYDSLSRLLTAHNPESGTITYSYDVDGNLLQKTSPAPNQTGSATQTISYCYDQLHRLTGKAYSAQSCPLTSPVVTYTYDSGANAKGKLTGVTDQAGSASYSYDVLGRLASETRVINGISKSLSYEYNLDGSLETLHYPSGAAITYAPDSAGRILSAIDTGNNVNYVTGATYQADGQMTGFVSGNSGAFSGITSAFSYNKRLQPINMSANAPGQTVFSIGYDFHVGNGTSGADNGNVWNIYNYRDRSRDQSFTYDLLNRLTSAQNAGADCNALVLQGKNKFWGNNYNYDPWGNLTNKTKISTACAGELLSAPALVNNQLSGYGYDAAGNMTSDPTDNVTASYDAENRIASASAASGTFTYTYDADGNRVGKSGGGSGTLYWYMTPGIVAESDLAGNLKSEYVFFNGERVARRDFDPSTHAPTGVFYYFSDHLKTASVITDSAGNVKSESDYYPWGGELQFVANDTNHYKFTGKERDSESGLDYFGARYYSNGLGRFITPDWAAKAVDVPYAEFADPQSLNLYSYVTNIPTAKADPDGHEIPVDPKDINIERVATFLKNFADAAASVYHDINDPLNRAAAQMCGCNKSGYYDVGNREAEDDTKNNHSFRQTEQGRDAQGKWVSKNPGEAAPGAQAEREALDAVGATKNTEAIPGSNRIPDGRIENAAGKVEQYIEGKSGASVSNTKQLREMARAAMKATGNRLKLVTTNPNVKIAKSVLQNEDIEIVKLNQK